ncbi:MAG: glycoside hydrolase 43 family protein [Bacteroidota bacterium]|nr:glycoside hydrolase 43 family protein [Bacteroidota bacterium]
MKKNLLPIVLVIMLLSEWQSVLGQHNGKRWGDLGNGNYRNMILPADYSDPDVLRMGKDYYLISSTFQFSPGIVILHSRDLVNWKTIGYVVEDLPRQLKDKRFDYTVMDHYSKGIYAPSLRYHNKKFWVYFTTYNGGGFYVATAKKITGPWNVQLMKDKNGVELFGLNWDDNCPLWDEDGKAYMIASNPQKNWFPILFQMSPDGTQLLDGDINKMKIKTLDQTDRGTNILPEATWGEGNKLFKKDGYYYLYHNECFGKDHDRRAVMIHSKNLYGTKSDGTPGKPGDPGLYDVSPQGTQTYLMVHPDSTGGRFDQGAIIDTPDGKKWYFLTHQGGGYENGRPIALLPLTWVDGWPMAGKDYDNDKIGEPVWEAEKPVQGQKKSFPQGSDEFSSKKLNPQWMWNYQPRADKWSLTERRGYLRLHAFKPLTESTFFKAGNTICQRYIKSDEVQVDVKMDISGMVVGQEAGLCHFNGGKDYCTFGVKMMEKGKVIKYNDNGKVEEGEEITSNIIWIRSVISKDCVNTYYLSTDGINFRPFSGKYTLKWGGFRGDYIGIYNYNNLSENGFVDIDWFRYRF